ncbi:MAG TPA: acyl-CoA dehydrogenase [Gammaproteobacteria bacterium]|nr:acyl-CoA dehydrogenase [Gammaproteobacteria bacterium]
MTGYSAPTRDMRFVITELSDFAALTTLPGFEEVGVDVVDAILAEAQRFSGQELAPLNSIGDSEGAVWDDGEVRVPQGFIDAYRQFVEGGWNGVSSDPEFGGMGLPELLAAATQEMWQSANMAWALCPLLTAGAVQALTLHGSEQQKALYLPKLVSGEWPGTMNLTEPQAGSDLSAVRTRAVPEGDHYRISGQKIFITWGEHQMAENIVHLVLARTPNAPAGVKGISLFVVPKFLPDAAGNPGERNDLRCVSIEHKMGIHGSPTCTMAFGDAGGAVGYLVGEEGRGLEYMFTMMNEARHKVGIQGLAIAERAYQQARDFARERVQGRPVGYTGEGGAPIIHHPDVRRMLLTMRAATEAMRALAYRAALHFDFAQRHPDAEIRRTQQARADLLIPVVKSWCTELGVEMASIGVQVHGGMGYIEETGAAQHLRDARITPIYEGTNGIQANDLVGRKLLRDRGAAMQSLLAELEEISKVGPADLQAPLAAAVGSLRQATEWLLSHGAQDPAAAQANSHHYLMLTGYTIGGALMAQAAAVAQTALDSGSSEEFYRSKIAVARFYVQQLLPRAQAHAESVLAGAAPVLELAVEQL